MTEDDTPRTDERAEEAAALLASIAEALNDIYEPAGVLIFWSSRIRYLDGQRPCDVWADQSLDYLRILDQHVNALADGAFA